MPQLQHILIYRVRQSVGRCHLWNIKEEAMRCRTKGHANEIFLSCLRSLCNESSIIADIGCGHNNWINLVNKRMGVGIDREVPSQVLNPSFVRGDIERGIPLKDDSCDIVICRAVIEHLKKPENTIKDIHRILRCGGIFVFLTVHRYFPLSLVSLVVRPYRLQSLLVGFRVYPTYYRLNTPSKIRKVLSSIGFREREMLWFTGTGAFDISILKPLSPIIEKIYRILPLPPDLIIGVFVKREI